jgi:hypothetical protein
MGHVCLGIVVDFGVTLLARYVLPWLGITTMSPVIVGAIVAAVAVSLWELSAFRTSVKQATGLFPLDRKLLRDNAIIAAAYMVLGVAIGFVFHQESELKAVLWFVGLVALGVACAPPWIRQKMIWQKASLPYLFRLADMQPTIGTDAAKRLQELIDRGAPPAAAPVQIVVGGPICSGRTPIAAGIGTEFAFKSCKVRFLDLGTLMEFAAAPCDPKTGYMDDTGPSNLDYWRWSEAQVLIIDDVGPLVAAAGSDLNDHVAAFRKLLDTRLGAIAPVLRQCHTVWVMGDLQPPGATIVMNDVLDRFAKAIAEFCQARQETLVIELSATTTPPGTKAAWAPLSAARLRTLQN